MRSPGREKKVYIPAMWDRSTVHDDKAKNLVGWKCVKFFFFAMDVIERLYKNGYYNLCKIRVKKEKKGRGDKGIKESDERWILIIFIINYKKEKREKVKEETKEWKDENYGREMGIIIFLIK